MKKIAALLILLVVALFALTSCDEGTTLSSSWAERETIVYDVTGPDGASVGTLTSVLQRSPSDNTLAGKTYDKASSKLSLTYAGADGTAMTVTALLDNFTPLASSRTYTAVNGSYTIDSYYSGKYYYYKLTDQNDSVTDSRIKVSGSFMDKELIYSYLRCNDISALSLVLSTPNAFAGSAQELSIRTKGKAQVQVAIGENGKNISCYEVIISKADSPVGGNISVFYAEANEENKLSGGLSSKYDSSKYPVKIIENDRTYTMTSITVS